MQQRPITPTARLLQTPCFRQLRNPSSPLFPPIALLPAMPGLCLNAIAPYCSKFSVIGPSRCESPVATALLRIASSDLTTSQNNSELPEAICAASSSSQPLAATRSCRFGHPPPDAPSSD